MTADQCLPEIMPTTTNRSSTTVRAGISTNISSSHRAWASTKSMPCLPLFARLLASSNSNSTNVTELTHKSIQNIPKVFTSGYKEVPDIRQPSCLLHPSHVLANPRQRVDDGYVHHAGAGQAGVHEDHPLTLFAHLAGRFYFLTTLGNMGRFRGDLGS